MKAGKIRVISRIRKTNCFIGEIFTIFIFASLLVILPLYMAKAWQIEAKGIGLVFTVNFAVFSFGQIFAGWICDKLKSRYDLIFSGFFIGLALLAIRFCHSIYLFIILLSVESFAAAWATVSFRRLAGTYITESGRGKSFGFIGSMGDLGELLGPLAAGIGFQFLFSWYFSLTGILALICTLVAILLIKKNRGLGDGLLENGDRFYNDVKTLSKKPEMAGSRLEA